MLKNTIIIILTLLLIITLYSYFCLSNKMLDYEKDRMEFICKKEKEITNKNTILQDCSVCQTELNNYKNSIASIKQAIAENISKINSMNQSNGSDTGHTNNSISSTSANTNQEMLNLLKNPLIINGEEVFEETNSNLAQNVNSENNSEMTVDVTAKIDTNLQDINISTDILNKLSSIVSNV